MCLAWLSHGHMETVLSSYSAYRSAWETIAIATQSCIAVWLCMRQVSYIKWEHSLILPGHSCPATPQGGMNECGGWFPVCGPWQWIKTTKILAAELVWVKLPVTKAAPCLRFILWSFCLDYFNLDPPERVNLLCPWHYWPDLSQVRLPVSRVLSSSAHLLCPEPTIFPLSGSEVQFSASHSLL